MPVFTAAGANHSRRRKMADATNIHVTYEACIVFDKQHIAAAAQDLHRQLFVPGELQCPPQFIETADIGEIGCQRRHPKTVIGRELHLPLDLIVPVQGTSLRPGRENADCGYGPAGHRWHPLSGPAPRRSPWGH